MENSQQQIEIMRHSLAHIMAAVVQKLYLEAKFGIGPAIENGFYYDFDLGDIALTPDKLKEIELEMKKNIAQDIKFERREVNLEEARQIFSQQPYKLEIIADLETRGESKVSIYQSGDFVDLCRGPHVNSSKELVADGFKLLKIAGAYWKGLEKNKMLTRVYGVAFASKKELEEYMKNLEEAEKRDHRKLGKELDLFHIDEEAGLGLILWHPKGAILWHVIEDFWYEAHLREGYELVRSPHIGNRKLWENQGIGDFIRRVCIQ